MAKKYEGGWGIRVRKNVLTGDDVWLDGDGELTTADKADKYENREEAYDELNNYLDVQLDVEGRPIDACDFAVAKLPIASAPKVNPKHTLNPNPSRPWDIIFDRPVPPPYEPDEPDYDDDCFPPERPSLVYETESLASAQRQPILEQKIPGFTYKKVDTKTKDGKKLLELIFKLFGI